MNSAVLLTAFALGRVLSAEEIVLDVVNGYTKTLPRQVRYVTGEAQSAKAASKSADIQGGKVTLVVEGKPSVLTVMADGFEPFKLDLRRRPSSIGLRPLASIRATLPSASGTIIGRGSSVRVFISNSHDPKPREVAPVTVFDQGVAFQAEAGTWRAALAVDGSHVAPFMFSAAPGESRVVDTLIPFGLKTRLLAPVKEDGSPAESAVAHWHLAAAVSDTQAAPGSRAAAGAEPGLTRLCEELLDKGTKRSPSNAVLRVDAPFGGALKASLSLEATGLRRLSLGPQDLAANDSGQAARLVMRGLPTIKVTVPRLRPGDDLPLTATISASAPPNDETMAAAKAMASASVVPGSSFSIKALADADHRIELRDRQGRMQGLVRVATSDRDWPQDLINRTLRREERTISGTVFWGAAPLAGARITAVFLGADSGGDALPPGKDDLLLSATDALEFGDSTDASGAFRLVVNMPGRYRVMPYVPDLKYAKSSEIVDVSSSSVDGVEIRFRDRHALLEIVNSESGDPVAGARVVFRSRSAQGAPSATSTHRFVSDENGMVVVGDLLDGDLEVEISARGYRHERLKREARTSLPPSAQRVELQKSARCEIRAFEVTGRPITGLRILAVGAEAADTVLPGIAEVAVTDESGSATFDAQPAGYPHLFASAHGMRLIFQPYYFARGCPAEPDLTLRAITPGAVPELRMKTTTGPGPAFAGARVGIGRSGFLVPWNELSEKVSNELGVGAILTGPNGELRAASVLDFGEWSVVAFTRETRQGQTFEQHREIGSFSLPLTQPTVIQVERSKK